MASLKDRYLIARSTLILIAARSGEEDISELAQSVVDALLKSKKNPPAVRPAGQVWSQGGNAPLGVTRAVGDDADYARGLNDQKACAYARGLTTV